MYRRFTTSEVLGTLGPRFKEYRLLCKKTQKDISEETAISIPTIYKFETGKLHDMTLSVLMKLMHAVGVQGDWMELIPEMPINPYLYKAQKKIQRIRK